MNFGRRFAIALLVAMVLGCGFIAAGFRYNGSHSFPEGLYLATRQHPHKGNLVFVNIPMTPIFAMAEARGYLNVGYSPVRHILKRLVGVAGDRVTIDSYGVEVNGILLTNSAPLPIDKGGRPLQPYLIKDCVLGPEEVLLMSDYNPASFDSRYFGPLQAAMIESVVRPLLTF